MIDLDGEISLLCEAGEKKKKSHLGAGNWVGYTLTVLV